LTKEIPEEELPSFPELGKKANRDCGKDGKPKASLVNGSGKVFDDNKSKS
jgi:hypothetical protein